MKSTTTITPLINALRSTVTRALLLVCFATALIAAPVAAQSPEEQQPPAAQPEQTEAPSDAAPADASASPQPEAAGDPTPPSETEPAADAATDAETATEPAPQAATEPLSPEPQVEPAASAPEPEPAPASPQKRSAPTVNAGTTPSEAAPPPAENTPLRIALPGGAYGEAQKRALLTPFTKQEGTPVQTAPFDGAFEALKAHAGEWDVVNIDGATAARGCRTKLLEVLTPDDLQKAPNGAPLADDFFPGALQPCAVASVAWSAIVVYDTRGKRLPRKLSDFFNTRRYRGKRLLPKSPRFTLEMALLADGVRPADVYAKLSTPEGLERAFAKLAKLKKYLQWYDKPAEAFELIAKKDVAMGLVFSGRAFMAVVRDSKPLGILWDRQIYAFDYWGIPRGSKNADAAKSFIRFATSPEPLANMAQLFPYGPARRSGVALVGKHVEVDIEMKPYLPTYKKNIDNALAFNAAWWDTNGAAIEEQFNAWIEKQETSH
ncbi:MAG: extracellular solute-binding protein [Alphaproteobacteria bacterium]